MRASLRRLPVLVLFLIAVLAGRCSAAAPNIVYILADDLGYGDLSCFGQTTLKTPNLDRMAAEGMRFRQHYAGSTVCAPSRCALLTGLHTGHCRIRGNAMGSILTEEDVTIAQLLKKVGYATGCVGKWGLGAPPPLNDPELRGFDHFFGYISMWHAHNFYPEFVIRNGKQVALRNEVPKNDKWIDGRGVATKRVDYVPDLVTEEALGFIEKNQDRPFFLYLAMNVPHANNEAGKKGMEVPDWGEFASQDWPDPEKGFASMIRNIDNDVGRVLRKLKSLGLENNTLVIFTSDNGPHQEGGHMAGHFDSNGPLRGIKRDVYDGGVRVPMIARWPGKVPAGATSDHICAFWDMLPTFCELAGADLSDRTDGISIVPTLLGQSDEQKKHDYLYWEFYEKGGRIAVRLGEYKGVRMNVIKNPEAPIELYRVTEDPGEQVDMSADHPQVVAEIDRIMKEAHAPVEEMQ
jgi:arylsulfatase A-like enzyme